MRRHIAAGLAGGVGAALAGLVSCAVHAEGLTEQQIAFAARLVQQESGGNQHDRAGTILTSSAGARGLFQLMPATAARFGVDPNTAEGNVRGGLTYIVRLWDRYRGDQRLIAAAYNCGEQCVDDWLGARRALPVETQHYVAAVAGGADVPGIKQHSAPTQPPAPLCEDDDWHVSRACQSSDNWASEREPDPAPGAVAAHNDDDSAVVLTAIRGSN